MLVTITKFPLKPGGTRAEALDYIEGSLPHYRGYEGLVRKYVTLDIERGVGQGIYLWESREQAEGFFEAARAILRKDTGAEPEIEFWDAPVIVDNREDTVWFADGRQV